MFLKNMTKKLKIKVKSILHRAVLLRRRIQPVMAIDLNGTPVKFYISSNRELVRANQYANLRKEPETYEWIDTFFKKNDVFFDVGANTGGYSIYAATKNPELKVFCFEPDIQNMSALNKNIYSNGLSKNITAYCVGISEQNKIDHFNIFDKNGLFEAGYAGNSVNSEWNRSGTQSVDVSIGVVSLTLDSLVGEFGVPFPNHLKIDVDGHENCIVKGAKTTLNDVRLKSILIEIEYSNKNLIAKMEKFGFKQYKGFKNPVYYEMEEKEHILGGMGNILFIRQ